ncbi:hypothetical protein ACQY0O_004484 [Thecaphora frezii]
MLRLPLRTVRCFHATSTSLQRDPIDVLFAAQRDHIQSAPSTPPHTAGEPNKSTHTVQRSDAIGSLWRGESVLNPHLHIHNEERRANAEPEQQTDQGAADSDPRHLADAWIEAHTQLSRAEGRVIVASPEAHQDVNKQLRSNQDWLDAQQDLHKSG